MENGIRTELPLEPEPRTVSLTAANWEYPNIDQLCIQAAGLLIRLKTEAARIGFTDPRSESNVQYCMFKVLALLIVAINAGSKNIHTMHCYIRENATLLKRMFDMEHMPSKEVLQTLLRKMDTEKLGRLICWVTAKIHIDEGGQAVVAMDAKTLCAVLGFGTYAGMLSALELNSNQLVSVASSGKGGEEISNLREMAEVIKRDWKFNAMFITADALHGDKKTLVALHRLGIHICVTIKKNRSTMHREFQALISRAKHKGHYATSEVNRTRDETRSYQAYLPDKTLRNPWEKYFKNEKCVPELGMIVEVTRNRDKEEEKCIVYLSKAVGIKCTIEMIRTHWNIEDKVHYTMDVSYREDDLKAYTENSSPNISVLNRGAWNKVV